MSAERQNNAHQDRVASSAQLLEWLIPALMLALVTLSGYSVAQGWGGENSWRFTLIALVSGVISAVLARSNILDGFAIVLAILTGAGIVGGVTAVFSNSLEGSMVERIRAYPQPVIDALFFEPASGINRELAADTLLGLTIWMSSWIAMWLLVRVRYALLALLAPMVLILTNEQFSGQASGWPIVVMVGLALMIIVGQRFITRQASWSLRQVPVAQSLIGRVFVTGLALAVLVSSTILVSPQAWSQNVLQPLIERSVERLDSIRLDAQYWFDDVLGTDTAPPRAGSYTDFSDGYQIDGPLTLTDEPEVIVRVDSTSAPYLKARTYDNYTGRGWVSSNAGEFVSSGSGGPQGQEFRYNPNWEVALSPPARNQRESVTASISPLSPGSDVVLTVDSFLSADIQTVVRMSWTTVTDVPLTVSINTLNQLPPDVQKLGSLLLQSELTGTSTSWGPGATSGSMQAAIESEVDNLARRGIEVRWTSSADGIVDTLYITGRLPVFDDVEAVFRYQSASMVSADYQSTGLSSIASADELASAGTDYPAWVTERYLQTGDTVTDRTIELTSEIVGGETNPYRQAVSIEAWLRDNIVYDESVEAPPAGQDMVDYVLFDHRYGYCEHYAAAMTVMLRSLGVPARVVVGYAPGEWDEASGGYLYRQRNAHAWVEAYFPGYGWIPFEPTANRPLGEFDLEATGQELDLSQPIFDEPSDPTEPALPTADVATPDVSRDNSMATPQPTSEDELLQPPTALAPDQPGGVPRWVIVGGLTGIALASLAGGVWLIWNWSLRGLGPAAGLMRRLQRVAAWAGIRPGPTTTPREFARKFEAGPADIVTPVKRITRAYEIETYGPGSAREQVITDAQHAWGEIKRHWYRLLRRRKNQ